MKQFRSPFGLLRQHQFLFEELVKRDFKKRYKGTILGYTRAFMDETCRASAMPLSRF